MFQDQADPAALSEFTAGMPINMAVLIIALLAATVWLAFALWALVERHRALRRSTELERQLRFQAAIMEGTEGAFLALDRSGRLWASQRLLLWAGREDNIASLADLRADNSPTGITAQEFAALDNAVTSLVADGTGFGMDIRMGGRRIWVTGRLSQPAPQGEALAVLWFEDWSDRARAIAEKEVRTEALETSLARLRDMVEAAPFPIWVRTRNLALTDVNQAYADAVEKPTPLAAVADGAELVTGSFREGALASAKRALDTDTAVESRHHTVIGGERRALSITNFPLGDGGGVAGFAIDITDQEEARAELTRYVDSQSDTLNKLSTPVAIYGADQRLEFFNSAFAQLSRIDEELLADKPYHGEILEEMRERRRLPEQADFLSWKKERLAMHRNLLEPLEEMWHLPDGSTLRVVAQPHPLGGLLILYEDVTDRLALERSYNTLIAVQRETLDNLHEGVAVYGGDGRLRLFNPAYARIWQLEQDWLDSGPHLRDVLEQSRKLIAIEANWERIRDRMLAQVMERQSESGRWYRPDSSVIDYAIVPLPDGNVLVTHVDMTASSRVEQALRDRNQALRTADRMKSEFVAHMSYELRTPLNSIIGFGEMLHQEFHGKLNDRQRDYAECILQSASQLRDLIDDILDLAVIEAGAMKLTVERFSVEKLIESLLAMTGETMRNRNVTVKHDISPGLKEMEGDRRRILQALYNLLSNAVKFSPDGGTVLVAATTHDDQVEFRVSDSGNGVKEDDQTRIFEKFFTTRSAGPEGGIGLGLSLVQSFVQLHGGDVAMTSEPGKGTTVICSLPISQATDNGGGDHSVH